jgi:uncharacterized protein YkwD
MLLKTIFPALMFLFFVPAEPELDKAAAKEAYALLNNIRVNPKSYAGQIGTFLNKQKVLKALTWNDTLAKVAEAKALDMAKNNYFGLVDKKGNGINYLIDKAGYRLSKEFLKHKKDSNFESIALGFSGPHEAIKDLLVDNNEPALTHRKHLLSQDKLHQKDTDIGVGFVRSATEKGDITYISIIIARHN